MKLLIAGGGTGGHLYPGIALAREWLNRDKENDVLFVGTERGIEAKILPREGLKLSTIEVGRLKGETAAAKLATIWGLVGALRQSRRILRDYQPDLVLGVGGYSSGPTVLAAWLGGIPTCIQEQNSTPGMTNKILGKVANRVFVSFPESTKWFKPKKTMLTGNPVRREISQMASEVKTKAKSDMITILVFGGSQGAHVINKAMGEALEFLDDFRDCLKIVHQTGPQDMEEQRRRYEAAGFKAEVHDFIYDMPAYFRRADLVVCRAGATSIAEILCCGLPALFIPFALAAENHQEKNARSLVEGGAAEMLLEKDLSGALLAEKIKKIIVDEKARQSYAKSAKGLARPYATRDIIDEGMRLIQG